MSAPAAKPPVRLPADRARSARPRGPDSERRPTGHQATHETGNGFCSRPPAGFRYPRDTPAAAMSAPAEPAPYNHRHRVRQERPMNTRDKRFLAAALGEGINGFVPADRTALGNGQTAQRGLARMWAGRGRRSLSMTPASEPCPGVGGPGSFRAPATGSRRYSVSRAAPAVDPCAVSARIASSCPLLSSQSDSTSAISASSRPRRTSSACSRGRSASP